MTQIEQIKNHLLAGNTLTPLEALGVFGCFRLAARIDELRNQGIDIDTHVKRDALGKKYASYSHSELGRGSTIDLRVTG